MFIKLLFTISILLGFAFVSKAQSLKLEDSLLINVDLFTVDNFGYIYTANNDVLVKYNYDLDTFFSASLKSFFPTSIEVSKSFRVMLFDKERGVVKFLDNTLTPIEGNIDLSELDVLFAGLVCESFNGNAFWVLDEENMQLLKINNKLEIILRVESLNFLFQQNGMPNYMREYNDMLYIYFPNKGIATFDVFGTFLKFYEFKAKWVQLFDEYIITLEQNQLSFYETTLFEKVNIIKLSNVTSRVKKFEISNGKLYLHTQKGIYIYVLNKN